MRLAIAHLTLVTALLAGASLASADAVSTLARCPPGAVPGGHAGRYCAPTDCADGCDYFDENRCAQRGLCIVQRNGIVEAVAACAAPSDCPAGSVCEITRRCVEPIIPTWAVLTAAAFAVLGLLLGVVLALRGRKRRGSTAR